MSGTTFKIFNTWSFHVFSCNGFSFQLLRVIRDSKMALRAAFADMDDAVGEISRLREVGFLRVQRVFRGWIKCRCFEAMANLISNPLIPMNWHALGSSLDHPSVGNGSCCYPFFSTRGQWLPMSLTRRSLFPSSFITLIWTLWPTKVWMLWSIMGDTQNLW